MQDGGYPAGAQYDGDAPWNQCELKPREVEVDVVITMSARKKILVDDYAIEEDFDEDGGHVHYGYSDCEIRRQFMEQNVITTELYEFKDYTIDELEVFLT